MLDSLKVIVLNYHSRGWGFIPTRADIFLDFCTTWTLLPTWL